MKVRLQHVLIQPVLVLDDGTEILPGPEVEPVALPLSQVAAWLEAVPSQLDQLQMQVDASLKSQE
jgi:hypothetical protein